jgi:hypothetical protein
MDVHLYHMATIGAIFRSLKWYWAKMWRRHRALAKLQSRHPIIIGEWSGVISGETMRHIPQAEHKELFRRYVELQLKQYEDICGVVLLELQDRAAGTVELPLDGGGWADKAWLTR